MIPILKPHTPVDCPQDTWTPTELPTVQLCKDNGHRVTEDSFLERKEKKGQDRTKKEGKKDRKEGEKEEINQDILYQPTLTTHHNLRLGP